MNGLNKLADLPMSRIVLISIFLCVVYYFIGYDDGTAFKAQAEASRASLSEVQARMEKVERELQEINALKAAQDKDAERLNVLLGFIPEKLSSFELMKTLSNEAKAVGVNINQLRDTGSAGLQPAPQGQVPNIYERLGVDLELDGSFAQLLLFLSNLTRLNQIVTLETLELRLMGGAESSLQMSAQIFGYRYLTKKEGAKPQ